MDKDLHNRDNLEDFFRQELDGFGEDPSDGLWEGIADKIPPKPATKIVWYKWAASAAAAILLVSSIAIFCMQQQKVNKLSEQVEHNQQVIDKLSDKVTDLNKSNTTVNQGGEIMPISKKNASSASDTKNANTAISSQQETTINNAGTNNKNIGESISEQNSINNNSLNKNANTNSNLINSPKNMGETISEQHSINKNFNYSPNNNLISNPKNMGETISEQNSINNNSLNKNNNSNPNSNLINSSKNMGEAISEQNSVNNNSLDKNLHSNPNNNINTLPSNKVVNNSLQEKLNKKVHSNSSSQNNLPINNNIGNQPLNNTATNNLPNQNSSLNTNSNSPSIPTNNANDIKGTNNNKLANKPTNKTNTIPPLLTQKKGNKIELNNSAKANKTIADALKKKSPLKIKTPLNNNFSRWFVGAYVSPNYAFRSVRNKPNSPGGGPGPGPGSHNHDNRKKLKEQESAAFSYSAGLQLGFRFSSKWNIKTGVSYTELSQKFNHLACLQYSEVNAEPESNGDITSSYKYAFDSSYGELDTDVKLTHSLGQGGINDGETVKIGLEGKQKLQFINVPLILEYQAFKVNNFSIGLNAGIIVSYLNNTQLSIRKIKTRDDRLRSNLKDLVFLTEPNKQVFTSDYQAGINIEYAVNNKISVFANPNFRRSFKPIYQNARIKTYPQFSSINLGFNLNL